MADVVYVRGPADAFLGPARVVRWEDPPPTSPGKGGRLPRSRWDAVADVLRLRPGQWAVIYEGPEDRNGTLATHIRFGATRCFQPAGDFDAATRTRNGVRTVYARYLGDGGWE